MIVLTVLLGFTVERMTDSAGNPVESAPHPFMEFFISMPFAVGEGDILRSAERE